MLRDDAVLAQARALNADFIMTHFCASEVADDPMNARQLCRVFGSARLFPKLRGSLLNSSGHFLTMAPAHDLTRPGYALYGGNPVPGQQNPMRPVIGLQAHIVQVRDVADGTKAGYNGLWTARGPRRLATISIGYADGYPRNGGGTDQAAGRLWID